jgi:hypothetical protein
LGENGVSIASLVQPQPRAFEKNATITVFTHRARESDVRAALDRIDGLGGTTAGPTQMIRIEEDPPLGAPAP